MARLKSVNPTQFKSRVISELLERLPALQPWPKDTHGLYTKPPSGSEVKAGIWLCLEDHTRTLTHPTRITRKGQRVNCPSQSLIGGDSKQYSDARDVILEYLERDFPKELEQLQDQSGLNIIQEVEHRFPGVFGNRGLGDADPVNLLVNRIIRESQGRPLEWIFSEIERALPDARKVAGVMFRMNELDRERAKLEREIKKVEEECNFWREATLKLSKEVPADDETMARLGWTITYK